MPYGSLLLTLRQINICLSLYEDKQMSGSGMTFAQVFLLNELFSMDTPCVCSTELCERVGCAWFSIDTRTERLDRLMKGRTTFVNAHRLSTVRAADCIMDLEQGRYYQLYTGSVIA